MSRTYPTKLCGMCGRPVTQLRGHIHVCRTEEVWSYRFQRDYDSLRTARTVQAVSLHPVMAQRIADGTLTVIPRRWNTDRVGVLAIHSQERGVVAVCRAIGCVSRADAINAAQTQSTVDTIDGPQPAAPLHAERQQKPYLWLLSHVVRLPAPWPHVFRAGIWQWRIPYCVREYVQVHWYQHLLSEGARDVV